MVLTNYTIQVNFFSTHFKVIIQGQFNSENKAQMLPVSPSRRKTCACFKPSRLSERQPNHLQNVRNTRSNSNKQHMNLIDDSSKGQYQNQTHKANCPLYHQNNIQSANNNSANSYTNNSSTHSSKSKEDMSLISDCSTDVTQEFKIIFINSKRQSFKLNPEVVLPLIRLGPVKFSSIWRESVGHGNVLSIVGLGVLRIFGSGKFKSTRLKIV